MVVRPSAAPALLLLAAVAVWLCGCAALTPYADVRARLPPRDLLEIDGRSVHVEQSGAGEAVVLLHGFAGSTYSWRRVAPAFAERYRVVAIDLNGFGYSERPRDPAAYTLDGQMHTVLAVLDRLGIGTARFVGHSYGGGLTLWIAARHPERVRSMVLVDSTLPLYSTERRSRLAEARSLNRFFLRTIALRPSFVARGLRAAYFDDTLATPAVVAEVLARLRVEGVDDAYYGLTAPNRQPPARVDLGTITTPALLLWGADDTLIKARDGEASARALGDARFVAFPRCGHVPIEEVPDAFLREALPFLAAH